MELDVSKLAADGLRLELDGPKGAPRVVHLAPSSGVTGRYRTDARAYYLDAGAEDALSLSEVCWPTEAADFVAHGARFEKAAVDIVIKRGGGTSGQIGARELVVDKLSMTFEGLDKPVVLRKLAMDRPGLALGDKALALVCQKAVIERVEMHLAGLEVVLHGVQLTGVRLRRGQGVWLVLADRVVARRVAVRMGEVKLIAESVEAQGVGVDGKVIRLARVFAPRAHVSGARLAAREAQPEARGSVPPGPPLGHPDLSALDGLDGKIELDLTVDAHVPVLGTFELGHHFRIAVDSGTVNYHDIESTLSTLEDAVLDFNVRDGELVLERAIPLLTKTLVAWPLDSRDLPLTNEHLVRIARLFDYRIPAKAPDDEGPGLVALRELRLDGLDMELGLAGGACLQLPGGGRLELGEDGRPALDELTVKGSLHHRAAEPEAADAEPSRSTDVPRTKLELTASMLNVGLNDVPVGTRRLSISAISVTKLERGSVRFLGLRPDGIDATLRDVELSSVRMMPA